MILLYYVYEIIKMMSLTLSADTARNPELMEMHSSTTDPPLCLMIGYTDGMQIWTISVSLIRVF